MTKLDFSIYDKIPKDKDIEYVLLQAGKGKTDYSSIYVNPTGFSYIEGLIWDKFREFNREKKNKIHSNECKRILVGFHLAVELLKDNHDVSELKRTLKFELTLPKYSLDNLLEEQEYFIHMLNKVIEWLTRVVSQEKFVHINYLS